MRIAGLAERGALHQLSWLLGSGKLTPGGRSHYVTLDRRLLVARR
jgi:hypothetical protein